MSETPEPVHPPCHSDEQRTLRLRRAATSVARKTSGSSIIRAGSLTAATRGGGRQPLPTYPVCCVPSVRRNAGYVNRFQALLSPDRLEASA